MFMTASILLFLGSCSKNVNTKIITYTASYTVNTNVCPDNYGFRPKGSSESLKPSFIPEEYSENQDLELVVILCNSISSSNLPQTIPAVIYKNGVVFLEVDLIRAASSNSAVTNRTYFYHFKHYK